MIRRTNSRKANGHAGPAGRPNGHDPASVERGGVPVAACPADSRQDHAASDDASGMPVACASASPVASLPSQASTDREAYAEAAPPRPQSPLPEVAGEAKSQVLANKSSEPTDHDPKKIPGGTVPLPSAANDFVEEIHRRVDLFEVWVSLLRNKDDKIRQRTVERLTDLYYKGAATSSEDPTQQVIIDIDSAVARRAAEGLKK